MFKINKYKKRFFCKLLNQATPNGSESSTLENPVIQLNNNLTVMNLGQINYFSFFISFSLHLV